MVKKSTAYDKSLERQLQAKIYDLNSFSAALSMHNSFENQVPAIFSLLDKIIVDNTTQNYKKRFDGLQKEYLKLGKPLRADNNAAEKYLYNIQEFSEDLLNLMDENFPLNLEYNL